MHKLLMETEPRILVLLMVSAALLVVAALGTYVIWPEYRDFRKSLGTLSVLHEVTSRGDNLAGEMSALRTSVERLNHELHGDMVNTPENEMESFIIGRLQTISWRNNIELLRVTPAHGNTVRVFEEVLFEVVVSGDYFDIFNWLQALDDELGFVVVKRFALQPDNGSDTGERLKANFTVVSYREVNDA
jgi:hypothetical protein